MTENTTLSEVVTEFSTAAVENNSNEEDINEQLKFIIVPLAVIATVMLLSALVSRWTSVSLVQDKLFHLAGISDGTQTASGCITA